MHPAIAAATTVCIGRIVLGKRDGAADARRMLALLPGKTHRMRTAIALARGSSIYVAVSDSLVTFAQLTRRRIDTFIDAGGLFDKGGA